MLKEAQREVFAKLSIRKDSTRQSVHSTYSP